MRRHTVLSHNLKVCKTKIPAIAAVLPKRKQDPIAGIIFFRKDCPDILEG